MSIGLRSLRFAIAIPALVLCDVSSPFTQVQTPSTIILYASAGAITGTRWATVADSTAAGGAAIFNADHGDAKLVTPFAMPASYVDLTFTAPAHVAYHLWLRMRAEGDAFTNDSVSAQFSDTVTTSGAADFRIGTTRAIAVVLEEGTNAGLSAWGWADNGYGTLGVNVQFATTGTHTLRLQQREDGVRIDQVVLSPSTYLATSPGTTKRDTTILPPNDGASPPAPGASTLILYASAGAITGTRWATVADSTAAGGAAIFNADHGDA
ncbi:MAG TPA: hypothetical protein VGJ29_19530, partial [Vicinamibacterales bacterium]